MEAPCDLPSGSLRIGDPRLTDDVCLVAANWRGSIGEPATQLGIRAQEA